MAAFELVYLQKHAMFAKKVHKGPILVMVQFNSPSVHLDLQAHPVQTINQHTDPLSNLFCKVSQVPNWVLQDWHKGAHDNISRANEGK